MIILDTNVLSALMREEPERPVVEWLDGQAAASIWITSITVFEVRLGLALLPDGRRRRALHQAFEELLMEDLGGRILSFDSARRRRGRNAGRVQTKGGEHSGHPRHPDRRYRTRPPGIHRHPEPAALRGTDSAGDQPLGRGIHQQGVIGHRVPAIRSPEIRTAWIKQLWMPCYRT